MNGCYSELASTVGSSAGYHAQLEAQTQDRKLEKQLIVSKDMLLYSTLLALGQVEKMREQSNKLETLECRL